MASMRNRKDAGVWRGVIGSLVNRLAFLVAACRGLISELDGSPKKVFAFVD